MGKHTLPCHTEIEEANTWVVFELPILKLKIRISPSAFARLAEVTHANCPDREQAFHTLNTICHNANLLQHSLRNEDDLLPDGTDLGKKLVATKAIPKDIGIAIFNGDVVLLEEREQHPTLQSDIYSHKHYCQDGVRGKDPSHPSKQDAIFVPRPSEIALSHAHIAQHLPEAIPINHYKIPDELRSDIMTANCHLEVLPIVISYEGKEKAFFLRVLATCRPISPNEMVGYDYSSYWPVFDHATGQARHPHLYSRSQQRPFTMEECPLALTPRDNYLLGSQFQNMANGHLYPTRSFYFAVEEGEIRREIPQTTFVANQLFVLPTLRIPEPDMPENVRLFFTENFCQIHFQDNLKIQSTNDSLIIHTEIKWPWKGERHHNFTHSNLTLPTGEAYTITFNCVAGRTHISINKLNLAFQVVISSIEESPHATKASLCEFVRQLLLIENVLDVKLVKSFVLPLKAQAPRLFSKAWQHVPCEGKEDPQQAASSVFFNEEKVDPNTVERMTSNIRDFIRQVDPQVAETTRLQCGLEDSYYLSLRGISDQKAEILVKALRSLTFGVESVALSYDEHNRYFIQIYMQPDLIHSMQVQTAILAHLAQASGITGWHFRTSTDRQKFFLLTEDSDEARACLLQLELNDQLLGSKKIAGISYILLSLSPDTLKTKLDALPAANSRAHLRAN